MRHPHRTTVLLALGVVILLDVLRVWLPSIITIFGRAAETPAELLGGFALGWFVLALAAPTLVRRLGPRPVGLAAAVVLAAVRLALTAAPGGRAQLWLACTGLLAGLIWLAASAAVVHRPVARLAIGLAAAAVGHALLATEDMLWRGGPAAWVGSVLLVAAFLAVSVRAAAGPSPAASGRPSKTPQPVVARPGDAGGSTAATGDRAVVAGRRAWLVFGPALLLAGQVALSPALWNAALSYRHGSVAFPGLARPPAGVVPVLPAVAVALFLAAAFLRPPPQLARLLWPAALVAGAVLFAADRPGWLVPAILLAAAGQGGCLGRTDVVGHRPERPVGTGPGDDGRGRTAVSGMLLFAVAAVGYRNAGQCSALQLQGGGEGPRGRAVRPERAIDRGKVEPVSGDNQAGARRTTVAAGLAETKNACGADVRPGQSPADRGEAGTHPGVARSVRSAEGTSAIHGGRGSQYAAYDLGYPNGWAPVGLAVLVGAVAQPPVPPRPSRSCPGRPGGGRWRRWRC
ncbi:hypothetical protein AB0H57_22450 [Micromonospora sp. NPDC050686]|uniref:hypothetical protein n=1 Tax=Micromonospora sp. NPDC050686 TaxID=3154631 RepID=UPI0034072F4A